MKSSPKRGHYMDESEARKILNENRLGKTFPRAVLEEARNVIREGRSLGSVMDVLKK